ncbi:hypothetical protein DUNSADRAFT_5026 [Dunaliella salina]|uniref:Encoded protein n=1 Tax=Dunaliella salina TaxID=3046 RepID=A0ABQ7HAB4_DUNSA|nr:hypothetical protein DUNSADRAFT_5026 [Dunaliella salina]|eukprot:KAF5843789.1 hypothetical protein DUNSADRAFT_5026 [Dunaliella salina]
MRELTSTPTFPSPSTVLHSFATEFWHHKWFQTSQPSPKQHAHRTMQTRMLLVTMPQAVFRPSTLQPR